MWDNLRHKDSVDDYIREHERVQALADTNVMVDEGMVIHTFLKNLKSHVHRLVRDEDCTTLEDAYREARNAEQKHNTLYPGQTHVSTPAGNKYNYKKRRYESGHKPSQNRNQVDSQASNTSKPARTNQVALEQETDDVIITSSKASANKDNLLIYPFRFRKIPHKLLLDTGAECSLFSKNFVDLHRLPLTKVRAKTLLLADQSKVQVDRRVDPISLNFGHLMVKIGGLVCPNLSVNIIGGLDWLRHLKPTIDWDTSTLTINRNGVNYLYPDGMHHLLEDYVFVKLVEVEESGPKLNTDNCEFHCICFYNVSTSTQHSPQARKLLKEFSDVFQDSLPSLPPT